jgi:low temperature requirement protein LtrA
MRIRLRSCLVAGADSVSGVSGTKVRCQISTTHVSAQEDLLRTDTFQQEEQFESMSSSLHTPTFHLTSRNRREAHRAATPLELMFDLAAVIAIAAAATGLHHAVAEAHFFDGILGFLYSFFMIWMAWMNYTWFASAYDNGSLWFRMLSMAIMFGALVLAAGIPAVFAGQPLYLALSGFVIMRLCLVVLWLAAARGDPNHRATALRYAGGITVMQVYWILAVLVLPAGSNEILLAFLLGFAGELSIPAFAERADTTSWHRHHIIERYGLLNIIVLGECFLAIVLALRAGFGDGIASWEMLEIGALASIITFTMWALYFAQEEHLHSEELKHALIWGYGHFALFAAGAATGAGFAVMVELATHHAHVSEQAAALAVAIPVAIYVFTLWLIRDRYWLKGFWQLLMPVAAGLIVLSGVLNFHALIMITLLLVLVVISRHRNLKRQLKS